MALNFYSRNLCNPNISICREGRQLLGAGGRSMIHGDSQAPRALILNHERGREGSQLYCWQYKDVQKFIFLGRVKEIFHTSFQRFGKYFWAKKFFSYAFLVAIEYIIKILVFTLSCLNSCISVASWNTLSNYSIIFGFSPELVITPEFLLNTEKTSRTEERISRV